MVDVSKLIDFLGGNAAVSRSLDVKPSAVSEMKRRGSIPPRYWKALIRLAADKGIGGISADALLDAHTVDLPEPACVRTAENAASATSCPVPSSATAAQEATR